jgi:AcrR family transcriptional regulator
MPPPSFGEYRLPRGNHGLSREQVAENQRWRLLGAASELLAEGRLAGLSSRLIARRASVSSHTFYAHFENVDDVLAAAFANAAKLLVAATGAAFAAHGDPEGAWGAALSSALAAGTAEPGLAALMRIELAVAVPAVGAERECLLGRLAALPASGAASGNGRAGPAGALGLAVDQLEGGNADATGAFSRELATLLS